MLFIIALNIYLFMCIIERKNVKLVVQSKGELIESE